MKNIYEKVADRILPKFSDVCMRGKCKHPKCECGHCSRNYHISKVGACQRLTLTLEVCKCKAFKAI